MTSRRVVMVGSVIIVVALVLVVVWSWSGGEARVERLAEAAIWDQVEEVLDGPIEEERRLPIRGIAALMPVSRTDATLLRWYSSPEGAAETTRWLIEATGLQPRSTADVYDEFDPQEWYDFGAYVDHDGHRWFVIIDVYQTTSWRLPLMNPPPVPAGAATLVSVHLSEER